MNKYVLAFSGQGSQYAGMGEEFFYQNSKVKNLFKTASEIVNHDLIDAGRTLGMSEKRIFFTVILPEAMPGIISGGVLSFARGLGEFGATAMLAGNIVGKTRTLPLAVYSEVMSGNYDNAGVYVFIIAVICLIAVVGVNIYQYSLKKKRSF